MKLKPCQREIRRFHAESWLFEHRSDQDCPVSGFSPRAGLTKAVAAFLCRGVMGEV